MRKLHLLILISFVCFNSYAQSVLKVENKFADMLERIAYWATQYENELGFDSLQKTNKEAVYYIIDAGNKVPGTISARFSRVDSIWRTGIITAEDGRVRIYNWDDYESGTARSYNSVVQYRVGAGVKASELCTGIRSKHPTEFCPSFHNLHSVQTPNANVYVVVKGFSYSSSMGGEEVVAFRIEGDSINWDVPLFKTKTKLLNSIFFEFEMFKSLNKEYEGMCFVKWDSNKDIFYIPVITEKMEITGKYFRYKFDGNYFVYDSIVNYNEISTRK